MIGQSVYHHITDQVISAYSKDYQDHKSDFIPAFLGNDVLRMWRTFCVNYEARTTTEPPEKKAKRKLKNYKLKHSRLLTCYSALLHLLFVFSKKQTVSSTDIAEMISLTPTQRLEWLQGQPDLTDIRGTIEETIRRYEEFLQQTAASEAELISRFLDKQTSRAGVQVRRPSFRFDGRDWPEEPFSPTVGGLG